MYQVSWQLVGSDSGLIITADQAGVRVFASSRAFVSQEIDLVVHRMREATRFHEALRDGKPVA